MKILLIQFGKNIKKWVLLFLKREKTLASKLKIHFHNHLNYQKGSKHFLVNMYLNHNHQHQNCIIKCRYIDININNEINLDI